MNNPIGVYIHIPFCRKKCNYCDFCSVTDISLADEYIDRLCFDIRSFAEENPDASVTSVFIGGGTPSVLSEKQISKLFCAVRTLKLVSDAEISVEINPESGTLEKLRLFKALGVNRISIGLQSADRDELKTLGRIHTREDFEVCFDNARLAGIGNINVDIMIATPMQTSKSLEKTLDFVISKEPEHISAYMLKIEENTPFYKSCPDYPDDDASVDMYLDVCKHLRASGYRHYEISNFAKNGYVCRHNMLYWQCREYVGFGVAAYSYFKGRRYGKTRELSRYIAGDNIETDVEKIDKEMMLEEFIMLSLRLDVGIDCNELLKKFGISFNTKYLQKVKKYIKIGYAEYDGNYFRLTDEGMCICNSVICDLIFD